MAGKFFGFLLILISFLGIYSYWFFSFKYIIEAGILISNLKEHDKLKVYDMLGSRGSNDNIVRGLILRLNNKGKSEGFWVWNLGGIKYYKVSENVKFNSFSICESRNWEKASGELQKSVNINYGSWRKKVRSGDYLELQLSDNRLVKDITNYDWWVFAQPLPYSYFEMTCEKK